MFYCASYIYKHLKPDESYLRKKLPPGWDSNPRHLFGQVLKALFTATWLPSDPKLILRRIFHIFKCVLKSISVFYVSICNFVGTSQLQSFTTHLKYSYMQLVQSNYFYDVNLKLLIKAQLNVRNGEYRVIKHYLPPV